MIFAEPKKNRLKRQVLLGLEIFLHFRSLHGRKASSMSRFRRTFHALCEVCSSLPKKQIYQIQMDQVFLSLIVPFRLEH